MKNRVGGQRRVKSFVFWQKNNIRVDQVMLTITTGVILVLAAFLTYSAYTQMKAIALNEAKEKAEILLNHNLAIHAFINDQLKPAIVRDIPYAYLSGSFDPTWMSSTYIVREIDQQFREQSNFSNYYYKEAAINARSPRNEADAVERSFLTQLNSDPNLQEASSTRVIDGVPFFTILLRGETMSPDCMRCHSTPDKAPQQMVALYGSEKSFYRTVGEVVSAVSIRIPISATQTWAREYLLPLAGKLLLLLLAALVLLLTLSRRLVFQPIERIRVKAMEIATNESALGQEIKPPFGSELRDLTEAFNQMSVSLREHENYLTEMIAVRTQALEDTSRFLTRVLGSIPDQVLVISYRKNALIYANQQAIQFWQIEPGHFDQNICDLFGVRKLPEDDFICKDYLREIELAENGQVISFQKKVLDENKCYRWLDWRAVVYLRDKQGVPEQILLILHDITNQKEAEEKLIFLSRHDPLTGLYNRAGLSDIYKELTTGNVVPFSVMMADVDNFKRLNDTYGHSTGDAFLQAVGQALQEALRPEDTVARMGGDEFLALLPGANEEIARQLKMKVDAKLGQVSLAHASLGIGVSAGFSTITSDQNFDDAIKPADQAMYHEKSARKESNL